MKFLKQEYDSFQEVIADNGMSSDQFSHVKKRGHLYVQQEGREDAFCFFRKKETVLNDQLEFEDRVIYYLNAQNKVSCESWEEVLVAFDKWLKKA